MAKTLRTASSSNPLLNQPGWFDKLSERKRDLICVGILYLVILVLCNKIIFNNMIFAESGDQATHQSWVKGIEHLQTTEHADPVWIPYIFSGMPIFGTMIILRPAYTNFGEFILSQVGKVLFFGCDSSWYLLHFFLCGAFMFILARMLKLSHLPSMFAAITLMMNPLAIELAEAGHGSKLATLSYIPLLFILTVKLFEKRNLLYLGLLSLTTATMLLASHAQIAFYGFMLVGLYLLYETILTVKEQPLGVGKNVSLFVLALMIGFVISAYMYLPTFEYSKYSIRGGSGDGGALTGLGYDYATGWSFHPAEMMNYLIPTTFGLSSSSVMDVSSTQQAGVLYWGWMPFTTSSVYLGIGPIILMILAIAYRRNKITTFLLLVSGFMFLLAFGKFSPFVYDLMFNYFPYFNKFRIPVMVLHLIPITVGLMAGYGMNFLFELSERSQQVNLAKLQKRLIYALGIIGGLLVIGFIAQSSISSFLSDFMFNKTGESKQYSQEYVNLFRDKRIEVFWSGYLKSSIFACLSLGALLLYLRGNLRRFSMGVALIAILMVDVGVWDNHYINPKPNNALTDQFVPDETMSALSAESDTSLFRVFPVEGFEDNAYMYHHIQSIGGYSPAKLKIYQEMRDSCRLDQGNMAVANMLNVKYLIREQRAQDGSTRSFVQPNPGYLPRAWFVDSSYVVSSKTEIFRLMNMSYFDPRHVALLEKKPGVVPQKPESSYAKIDKFTSGNISIDAFTSKPSLLVLSEIYYPAGWKAFIDGSETEIYKTNYILRSVIVPEGKHRIEYRFQSQSYDLGYLITKAGWGICAVILIIGGAQMPRVRGLLKKGKKEGRETA